MTINGQSLIRAEPRRSSAFDWGSSSQLDKRVLGLPRRRRRRGRHLGCLTMAVGGAQLLCGVSNVNLLWTGRVKHAPCNQAARQPVETLTFPSAASVQRHPFAMKYNLNQHSLITSQAASEQTAAASEDSR